MSGNSDTDQAVQLVNSKPVEDHSDRTVEGWQSYSHPFCMVLEEVELIDSSGCHSSRCWIHKTAFRSDTSIGFEGLVVVVVHRMTSLRCCIEPCTAALKWDKAAGKAAGSVRDHMKEDMEAGKEKANSSDSAVDFDIDQCDHPIAADQVCRLPSSEL